MKIEGEHVFKGPREEVWVMFRDPEVLSKALPGAQDVNKLNEQEFEVVMNLRVGPVTGKFSGKMEISNEVPPESCTLVVVGEGGPGFARGTGDVTLLAQDDGTTLMKYTGEVQIGGKLAGVGQRMLDTVSKSMIKQSFGILDKALEARLASDEGQAEIEVKAPTEAEFAAGVAKDVATSFVDSRRGRLVIYIVVIVVVLILAAIIFSSLGGA